MVQRGDYGPTMTRWQRASVGDEMTGRYYYDFLGSLPIFLSPGTIGGSSDDNAAAAASTATPSVVFRMMRTPRIADL